MDFPKLPFDQDKAVIKFSNTGKTKEYKFPVNVQTLVPELEQEGKVLIAAKVEGAVKNLYFNITHHKATVAPGLPLFYLINSSFIQFTWIQLMDAQFTEGQLVLFL